jgi:hypothetical protein
LKVNSEKVNSEEFEFVLLFKGDNSLFVYRVIQIFHFSFLTLH